MQRSWSSLESDLRNCLKEDHLSVVTRLYLQNYRNVRSIPYDEALETWHQLIGRYGAGSS